MQYAEGWKGGGGVNPCRKKQSKSLKKRSMKKVQKERRRKYLKYLNESGKELKK